MSRKKLVPARVLCSVPAHGVTNGQILEAAPAVIEQLQQAGQVDAHPDAVAYAKTQGAEVKRSAQELSQDAGADEPAADPAPAA